MLTELSLQEFKAHGSTRFELERLTALVGPNACGKTSALEAMLYLSRASQGLGEVFPDERAARWSIRRGAAGPMQIRGRGATEGNAWTLTVTVPPGGDATRPTIEQDPEPFLPGIGLGEEAAILRLWDRTRWSAILLRLDARRLAEPSYSEEETPRLAEDGYGLATVLSTLKLSSTERFRELEEAARRIVPSLRRIGFKRTRIEQHTPRALTIEGQKVLVSEKQVLIGDELLLDFVDASDLPAHAASEGTLIALGLLATLYGPSCPRLVLLDDLERALHPKAQQDLAAGLRAALDAAPDVQVVATTHSPYLVDALRPEEVVVLARGRDGAVAAKRLRDHPKAHLLDALTTGEFWSAEGEDWVTAP
ncbi:MAG: AAA family ATPase [Polyangiaceae bacterium]|nr:AAA family ATPase [Polyangiaceae bacterium]